MSPSPLRVNVLMSGGFTGAYEQLLPEFERASGIKVTTGSGASQGTGPQTMGALGRVPAVGRGAAPAAARWGGGHTADVVILARAGLAGPAGATRIAAGAVVDLARVPLGVAVRAGATRPDVSTVDAFKQVLL